MNFKFFIDEIVFLRFKLEWTILRLHNNNRLFHRSTVINHEFFRLKLLFDVSNCSPELFQLLFVSHLLVGVAETLEAFYKQCGFGVVFEVLQQQVCDFVVQNGLINLVFLHLILAAVKQPNYMTVSIFAGYVAELEKARQSRSPSVDYF